MSDLKIDADAISVGERSELIRLYAALEGRAPESIKTLLTSHDPQNGMVNLDYVPMYRAALLEGAASTGAFKVLMSHGARWMRVSRRGDGSVGVARNEHPMIPLDEALSRSERGREP